jgi:hypothetical protein
MSFQYHSTRCSKNHGTPQKVPSFARVTWWAVSKKSLSPIALTTSSTGSSTSRAANESGLMCECWPASGGVFASKAAMYLLKASPQGTN